MKHVWFYRNVKTRKRPPALGWWVKVFLHNWNRFIFVKLWIGFSLHFIKNTLQNLWCHLYIQYLYLVYVLLSIFFLFCWMAWNIVVSVIFSWFLIGWVLMTEGAGGCEFCILLKKIVNQIPLVQNTTETTLMSEHAPCTFGHRIWVHFWVWEEVMLKLKPGVKLLV